MMTTSEIQDLTYNLGADTLRSMLYKTNRMTSLALLKQRLNPDPTNFCTVLSYYLCYHKYKILC